MYTYISRSHKISSGNEVDVGKAPGRRSNLTESWAYGLERGVVYSVPRVQPREGSQLPGTSFIM